MVRFNVQQKTPFFSFVFTIKSRAKCRMTLAFQAIVVVVGFVCIELFSYLNVIFSG